MVGKRNQLLLSTGYGVRIVNNRVNHDMEEIIRMIAALPDTTTRPMFGYRCYSVKGKFFAGFGKTNNLIIRLPKDQQLEALGDKHLKIKPFSRGAKMGWVELDGKSISNNEAVFEWLKKGYEHALRLSKTR